MLFLCGHNLRCRISEFRPEPYNISGLCMCGCGQMTEIATQTDHKRGRRAGFPQRFIRGHHRKGCLNGPLYFVEDRGYKTPCWIWAHSLGKNGYGSINRNGKTYPAHKFEYEKKYGPVPTGLDLDHLCRVRACMNPDHVEPVIKAVNTQRGKNAKLTADDVRFIREARASGTKTCSLAKQFGVDVGTIQSIVYRRSWKNIP